MLIIIKNFLLVATTLYQLIASWLEDRQLAPGKMFDVGGYNLHLYSKGETSPTIIVDHSLGGIEGYLLIEELAKLTRVCIYDRAGYGWSDHSPYPRTSEQIVKELNTLLIQARIEPPYILIGDSFGSYNVRLYAHRFPDKVIGIILTDGLHETEMLKMPIELKALKLFFISGFLMSMIGSTLGIIRLLSVCGIFEIIKPELKQFSRTSLNYVKRSFCRVKHWLTMCREMFNLQTSGEQLRSANEFGNLPIVSIKANSFFKPSILTIFVPLKSINRLRDKMHLKFSNLSTNFQEIDASKSGHFVWVDQPYIIIEAVKIILNKVN